MSTNNPQSDIEKRLFEAEVQAGIALALAKRLAVKAGMSQDELHNALIWIESEVRDDLQRSRL